MGHGFTGTSCLAGSQAGEETHSYSSGLSSPLEVDHRAHPTSHSGPEDKASTLGVPQCPQGGDTTLKRPNHTESNPFFRD